MMVSVADDEQSHVTTYACDLPIEEYGERLQNVDLYSFIVTDGTEIQLSIEMLAGSREAWYTVYPDAIIAHHNAFTIDVFRSSESVPFPSVYTQKGIDEVLLYYEDQIRD